MPRWPGVVGTVLCVLGLGVAGYLTYEHFTSSSTLACSDNGVVNCLKVTTSSYSAVAGVPVAVLGLVFFAVMLVLQLPPMWRRPEPSRPARPAGLGGGRARHRPLPLLRRALRDRRHLPVVHLRARAHAGALRDDRIRHVLLPRSGHIGRR